MSGQTQHSPVKTLNLLDKCQMTGTNLQACSGTQGPRIVKTRSVRPVVFFPLDLERAKDINHNNNVFGTANSKGKNW